MCRENKGSDQLRSYCEADLCLCFRLQIVGFTMRRLNCHCLQIKSCCNAMGFCYFGHVSYTSGASCSKPQPVKLILTT